MAMDFTKGTNAQNLKKIQKKSNENSNSVVAIDIDINQIDKNEDNEKIFNMGDIEYLAKGIEDEGFFGAIEVYRKPNGRYEISAGHRRYEAMKYLKRPTIPCIVRDIPDDITRGKKLLSSNLRNRKLSPMDMSRALDYYEKILKNAGQKKNFIKQAAEFFNISEAQVYRFQCLGRVIPELQELANMQGFPYSSLQNAVSLTEDGQKELYRQLAQFMEGRNDSDEELGITRARIEALIRSIREIKENQKKPYTKKNKEIVHDAIHRQDDISHVEGLSPVEEELEELNTEQNSKAEEYEYFTEEIKPKKTKKKINTSKVKEVMAEINKLQDMVDNIDAIDEINAKESIDIFYRLIEELKIKSS